MPDIQNPEVRIFLGLSVYGRKPETLSDDLLLQQIVTVARVKNYLDRLLSGDSWSQPDPERMRGHYGILLCDDKLEPLIDEARARVKTGSKDSKLFLAAVDNVIGSKNRRWNSEADAFSEIIPDMYDNALIRAYQRKLETLPVTEPVRGNKRTVTVSAQVAGL